MVVMCVVYLPGIHVFCCRICFAFLKDLVRSSLQELIPLGNSTSHFLQLIFETRTSCNGHVFDYEVIIVKDGTFIWCH